MERSLARFSSLTTFVLAAALPVGAQATPLRIDFGGEIDTVDGREEQIADGFGVGTPFDGFLEFDPDDARDGEGFGFRPGAFLFGGFFGGGGFFAIRMGATVGGATVTPRFITIPQVIALLNDVPSVPDGIQDVWMPQHFGDPGVFSGLFGSCSLALVDTTADALPGGFFVPHDLEAFDQPTFTCAGFEVNDDGASVSVVALSGRNTKSAARPTSISPQSRSRMRAVLPVA